MGAYYRRNDDDYAFNRFAPVPTVHPFQHTSYTRGMAFDGRQQFTNWAVVYRAQWMSDFLESTSLLFGRFHSRDYGKVAVVPETAVAMAAGQLTVRA